MAQPKLDMIHEDGDMMPQQIANKPLSAANVGQRKKYKQNEQEFSAQTRGNVTSKQSTNFTGGPNTAQNFNKPKS